MFTFEFNLANKYQGNRLGNDSFLAKNLLPNLYSTNLTISEIK